MFKLKRYFKHRRLKRLWDRVQPGMTIDEAQRIMGFEFSKDSENEVGRVVYSNHSQDYLPFYLVVDGLSGKIVRRHSVRALDELLLVA